MFSIVDTEIKFPRIARQRVVNTDSLASLCLDIAKHFKRNVVVRHLLFEIRTVRVILFHRATRQINEIYVFFRIELFVLLHREIKMLFEIRIHLDEFLANHFRRTQLTCTCIDDLCPHSCQRQCEGLS